MLWLVVNSGVQRPHMQALYTATHSLCDAGVDVNVDVAVLYLPLYVDVVSYQFNSTARHGAYFLFSCVLNLCDP
jgi:hypothetical protein